MPLLKLNDTKSERIALWHITEDETFFRQQTDKNDVPDEIINPRKRLEWLSGRMLLRQLAQSMKIPYNGIIKDDYGKPFLKGHNHQISLSHSYPYVAAQISHHSAVGIDIEQPTEKLLRIGPRILDPTEQEDAGNDIVKHCVYWCAKEALYKLYGKRGLLFTHHLKVDPFQIKESGDILGRVEFDEIAIFAELRYIVNKDYVLVYTKINS